MDVDSFRIVQISEHDPIAVRREGRRGVDGRVGGQGLGFLRQGQDTLDHLWAANVVAVVEAFDGAGLGLLEVGKGGPFEQ